MKYTPIWIQRDIHSVFISMKDAPKLLSFTKPFIPNVDGKISDRDFQKGGMALAGHDIPLKNKRGIELNNTNNIISSLYFIKQAIICPNKIVDKI